MTTALLLALSLSPALAKDLPDVIADFEAGRYHEVVAALPAAEIQRLRGRDAAQATLLVAKSHERLRRSDRALSVYQLGIKLHPNDIPLLIGLAELFTESALIEQARPLFLRVLEIEPRNLRAHVGLARIDRSLGFLDRSADHYETALEVSPVSGDLWRAYAEVLLEQRDTKTAELAAEKALSVSPNSIDSLLVLAYVQRAAGRLSEALSTIDRIIAITGRQTDLALARALWLLEASEDAQARSEAEAVAKAEPGQPLAHWILGRLALGAGDAGLALKHLRIASQGQEGSFVSAAARSLIDSLGAL